MYGVKHPESNPGLTNSVADVASCSSKNKGHTSCNVHTIKSYSIVITS